MSCDAFTPMAGMPHGGGQEATVLSRLDKQFQAVAAVVCRTESRPRPGGGSNLVAVEERADDVAALVVALRLPDRKPKECAYGNTGMPFVPWLALLDAQGRWVRPGVPVDACRKPRPEFVTAYEQLGRTPIATRVLRENDADDAVDGGCARSRDNRVVSTAGLFDGTRDPDPAVVPAGDTGVHICFYLVSPAEQGSSQPLGEVQSGGTLTARKWAAVRRELTAAGPAAPCRAPSSRFAELQPVDRYRGMIYVEADGCRRVLVEDVKGVGHGWLLQGTAALTSLVFDR